MFKKLIRLAATAALLATIVWLTRERLLPTPRVADDPAPHYRSTPPPPQAEPDDLTLIKGIGPVYASRLGEAGIISFRALAETDPVTAAETVGTTEDAVIDWVAQAKNRLS